MYRGFLKKILSVILIPALILSSFFGTNPQKAEAIITVQEVGANLAQQIINTGSTIANTGNSFALNLKEFVLDYIPQMIAKQIIRQLTTSIVNWINSGFEGNPSFLTDPAGFFIDMADEMVGEFIANETELGFLCSNFDIDIRIAIALQYRPYQKQVPSCTLSKIITNSKNAVNSTIDGFTGGDFSQGGWPAFMSLTTEPQNNVYGSFIRADHELTINILDQRHRTRDEISQGGGFLSFKKCVDEPIPGEEGYVGEVQPSDYGYEGVPSDFEGPTQANQIRRTQKCTTETPGSVINNQLGNVLGSGFRSLELADEINEIVNALVAQLVMQVIGSGGLRSVSGSGASDPTSYINRLQNDTAITQEQLNTLKNEILKSIDKFIKQGDEILAAKRSSLQAVTSAKTLYDNARSCYQLIVDNPLSRSRNAGNAYSMAVQGIAAIDAAMNSIIIPRLSSVSDSTTYEDGRLMELNRIKSVATNSSNPTEIIQATEKFSNMINGLADLIIGVKNAETERDAVIAEMASHITDAQRMYQQCSANRF